MAVASRQLARRGGTHATAARAIAACIGLWFVVGGALGARHEAGIAHVHDARTGLVVHAAELTEHHDRGKPLDVHRQDAPDNDRGPCGLSVALHQAASDDVARVDALERVPAETIATPPTLTLATATLDVYRLAPKTSPPARG